MIKRKKIISVLEDILQEKEDGFKNLSEYITDAFFMIDRNMKIIYWNKAAEKLMGVLARDAVEKKVCEIFKNDNQNKKFLKVICNVLNKNQSDLLKSKFIINGREILFEINLQPFNNGVSVFFKDITEKEKAREHIIHLNKILNAMQAVNRIIIKGKSPETMIRKICDIIIKTRGFYSAWIMILSKKGKFINAFESGFDKEFRSMLKNLKKERYPKCVKKVLSSKKQVVLVKKPKVGCLECPLKEKYLSEKAAMAVRLEYNRRLYGVMVVSIPSDYIQDENEYVLLSELADDIAYALNNIELNEKRLEVERRLKSNQEKLQVSKKNLKKLAGEILKIRECEKKKLAIDLHDSVSSMAVNINTKLNLLKQNIQDMDIKAICGELENIENSMRKSVDKLRNIAVELRPPHLNSSGLPEALSAYIEKINDVTDIEIEFYEHIGSKKINDDAIIALYRVVQEAINNVIEHSEARKARVELFSKKDSVFLNINDDGKGFDINELEVNGNGVKMGIWGMRERIESVGGRFDVKSTPGKGSEIRVKVKAV